MSRASVRVRGGARSAGSTLNRSVLIERDALGKKPRRWAEKRGAPRDEALKKRTVRIDSVDVPRAAPIIYLYFADVSRLALRSRTGFARDAFSPLPRAARARERAADGRARAYCRERLLPRASGSFFADTRACRVSRGSRSRRLGTRAIATSFVESARSGIRANASPRLFAGRENDERSRADDERADGER